MKRHQLSVPKWQSQRQLAPARRFLRPPAVSRSLGGWARWGGRETIIKLEFGFEYSFEVTLHESASSAFACEMSMKYETVKIENIQNNWAIQARAAVAVTELKFSISSKFRFESRCKLGPAARDAAHVSRILYRRTNGKLVPFMPHPPLGSRLATVATAPAAGLCWPAAAAAAGRSRGHNSCRCIAAEAHMMPACVAYRAAAAAAAAAVGLECCYHS
jgi:hypothetical protein